MDQEKEKSGWKIWLYLTPVYILIAIPLLKWTMKVNSGDVGLSKEEETVFNSSEGEIKKNTTVYTPELADTGYSLHYRTGNASDPQNNSAQKEADDPKPLEPAKNQRSAAKPRERKTAAGYQQAASQPRNAMKEQEQKSFGFTKGYLTYAVGQTMNNPKAVSALFNNSFVVGGFMSRGTVKSALGSAQGLQNYLSNATVVNNFLGNSVVKAALGNPQVINAVASSSLASAIINSPAMQDMLKNPDSLNNILSANPQIATLMANPNVANALMNNPETAGVLGGLNIGGNTGKR